MAIKNIQINEPGQAGVVPRIVRIETDDSVATVTAAGYLSDAVKSGLATFKESDMCCVVTQESASAAQEAGWYEVSKSGAVWSLVPPASPGDVVLPTVANRLAHFSNTTGTLSGAAADVTNLGDLALGASGTEGVLTLYPTTAASGSLVVAPVDNSADAAVTISNADHGQATVISIPDGGQATAEFIISDSAGTQHITSGALQVDAGAISSGLAAGGSAGNMVLWANTTASGNLALLAVDNASGDFDTVISNAAAVGQDQTITIPDAGASTANFLLDTGAANIIAHQEFVGLQHVLNYSAGTWTRTRVAQGNYAQVKTQADDTTIIGIDVSPQIRAAAAKGFRLDSFDVIYQVTNAALDAHSVTLDRIEYADNAAVSVNSIAITGTLATATQANPYLTNVAVDSPAFDVTADSKYIIEVTVDAAATSDYSWYGIMLRFSETIA
jgi:hypothetical protein